MPKYDKPGWFTTMVANPLIALMVKVGMSPAGAHILAVRGRKSGKWHTTPINPLDYEGARYLVAPRGETEWVRNLRAAGVAMLRLGTMIETVRAEEIGDEAKPPVLRAYLDRWARQTSGSFGVDASASDDDLKRIAPSHPAFRIASKA